MQAGMVLELWDLFQEYVPASKKAQAAQDIVRVFAEQGSDLRWFDDIMGEDDILDQAIHTVLELEEEVEDDTEWEE
jgi:hypothetical protein